MSEEDRIAIATLIQKVDNLASKQAEHGQFVHRELHDFREECQGQAKLLSVVDERSRQQGSLLSSVDLRSQQQAKTLSAVDQRTSDMKDRMDRMGQRATIAGAISGLTTSLGALFGRGLFGGGN